MSNSKQKSERRKEQNRRAQANLRRKQQERIEDLHQQIRSLKAQAQAYTEVQQQYQNPGHRDDGEISNYYDGFNRFQADIGDIPNYLIEEDWLVNSSSISTFNTASYVQQPSTPLHPLSDVVKSPVASKRLRVAAGSRSQNGTSVCQPYHCAFDALAKNAALLGISPESFLSTSSNSIFYSPLQSLTSFSVAVEHLPSEFHPTMAQLSYPHQPWIDCIPLPELRSRIIFGVSHNPPFLNSFDVWHDVLFDGLSCAADPQEARLWTMSSDFAQRWQMLLRIDLTTLETMCLTSNPPLRRLSLPSS